MTPNRKLRALTLVLAALVAASPCYAQRANVKPSGRNTRPSDATEDIGAQNPFATRANRTARPAVEPAATTPAPEAPTIAPRAQTGEAPGVDVMTLRDGTRLEGALTRLSGAAGATIVVDGQERVVPLAQIERLDASVSEAFVRAVDAFESGRRSMLDSEFRRALALFKESRSTASRVFEKEWATAKIVETNLELGRQDDAAVEFFILCRLDPYPAFLSSIPLRWQNQRSARTDASAARRAEEEAAKWLDARDNPSNAPNPSARLLAASILLRSAKYGAQASAATRELCTCEAPEDAGEDAVETCRAISLLALAQLWRDEVLKKPDAKSVDRWSRTLELLPNAYKPGPAALVGAGTKALGDDAQAARFLTLTVALSHDRELVRDAAAQCAEALTNAGDKRAAEETRSFLSRDAALNEAR